MVSVLLLLWLELRPTLGALNRVDIAGSIDEILGTELLHSFK